MPYPGISSMVFRWASSRAAYGPSSSPASRFLTAADLVAARRAALQKKAADAQQDAADAAAELATLQG